MIIGKTHPTLAAQMKMVIDIMLETENGSQCSGDGDLLDHFSLCFSDISYAAYDTHHLHVINISQMFRRPQISLENRHQQCVSNMTLDMEADKMQNAVNRCEYVHSVLV